jgi:hypothetical protein
MGNIYEAFTCKTKNSLMNLLPKRFAQLDWQEIFIRKINGVYRISFVPKKPPRKTNRILPV